MILRLRDKLINKLWGKIPLRIVLILPFVLTILVTVLIVGYLSFKNGQNAIKDVAGQYLNELTARVERTLPSYLYLPNKINQMNAVLVDMKQVKLDNVSSLENFFWKEVDIFDKVAFIGIGLENKTNVGAERLPGDLMSIRSSSKASNYVFQTFQTNNKGEKTKMLNSIPFDPRTRPWYTAAVKSGKPVWSKIYPNTAGITSYLGMSMPFYDKNKKLQGVFITTVNLMQIGDFLKNLKIGKTGQAFIIEKNGFLVATSTGEQPFAKVNKDYGAVRIKASQTKNPITRLTAQYLEEHSKEIIDEFYLEIKLNNENQFIVVRPFRDKYGLDWLIAVVVPEKDFMEKINENTRLTILFSLLAMFIAIFSGIYLTSIITKPLLDISREMNLIANFEIDKNDKFASIFSEIELIQSSLVAMKKGLRSFEKYVSSDIVRSLIKTNKEAVLGVENANVTVFFSDVADFTTISETLPMDSLVEVISEYLGEMTTIILSNKGTLDKYIGDAIMAFWNAPIPVEDYPKIACKVALECLEKLSELRIEWENRNLPPLRCRIGLHSGHVLVGNLGSKKRMDYTVIGDTVNLASRLEALNKYYGTEIIISDDLYNEVKDEFLCRPLDIVSVKGRTKETVIYELISTREKADEKQEKFAELYTEALWLYRSKKFREAIFRLERILTFYPDDLASKSLYSRAKDYEINPPDANWDGVYIYSEK